MNRVAKLDPYPIPRIEDLFASLTGGKLFTKLDLVHADQQIPLDEEHFVVINTYIGLFQYNRLPFGVTSGPAIFHKAMESILQGIEHVTVYIDDILFMGRTEIEHLQHLTEVLTCLENAGIRLKKDKCAFMLPSISGVSWPRHLSRGLEANVGEDQSNHSGANSKGCVPAEVLLGPHQLLQ